MTEAERFKEDFKELLFRHRATLREDKGDVTYAFELNFPDFSSIEDVEIAELVRGHPEKQGGIA